MKKNLFVFLLLLVVSPQLSKASNGVKAANDINKESTLNTQEFEQLTLEEKKVKVSNAFDQLKGEMGDKKAEKLKQKMLKKLDKAEQKGLKFDEDKMQKREALLQKLMKNKKIEEANAANGTSQMRLGVILAIAGALLYLLVNTLLGGIFLAVGLLLIILSVI